jgi:hypothetical protein
MGQLRRQEITDLSLSPNSGTKCFPQFRLILTNPPYGFHACWALLALRAVEAGNDLAGRIQRAICKEERHVQADQLHVCSIHFACGLLLSVSAVGQFEVAPDHFDSTSKTETVRRAATKSPVKHKVLAGAQANRRHAAGTSRSSVSTTAHAHAAINETHPKTTASLGPRELTGSGLGRR